MQGHSLLFSPEFHAGGAVGTLLLMLKTTEFIHIYVPNLFPIQSLLSTKALNAPTVFLVMRDFLGGDDHLLPGSFAFPSIKKSAKEDFAHVWFRT